MERLIGVDLVGAEYRRATPCVKDHVVGGEGSIRTLPGLAPGQVLISPVLTLSTLFAPVDVMPTRQLSLRDLSTVHIRHCGSIR
jgi:hypothetical protein